MSNTINPYKWTENPVDHSNTAVAYDGIGYNIRDFDSHKKEGFVVFVDFLGIKGIWKRMTPETAFSFLKRIISDFANSLQISGLQRYSPYFMTLSDTIIITCACPKEKLGSIFDLLLDPFIRSLEMEFPLRGSISYGSYFLSTRFVIGEALDEAVYAHNQLEIIGICTSKELSNEIKISSNLESSTSMTSYKTIPTKMGVYDGFILDWRKKGGTALPCLKKQLSDQKEYGVRLKYENTINFYEMV